jgi:secreted Zn-dependent insulinase-like peptidase
MSSRVSFSRALISRLLTSNSAFCSEAGRLFNLAFEQNAEFDVSSREIRALEKLTREDILDFINSYLLTSKQRKLILRMSGKDHEAGKSADELISSTAKFKKLYACPHHCLP